MKILSWNVNGLKARLDAVNRIVKGIHPDILCFQKVRKKGDFIINIPDYMGWIGSMGDALFGGVSTYIHNNHTIDFETQRIFIPEWLRETGCINVINLESCYLINLYVPYVDVKNQEYIKIRQRWDYELHDYLVRLSKRKPLIVCGDLNIVTSNTDAWDDVSVKNSGCFLDWEHRNFDSLMKETGLVDTYRYFHPKEREFTYFYNNNPEYRLLNQGFRIDYFLVSDFILPYVKRSDILTDVMDTTNNPITLELDLPAKF